MSQQIKKSPHRAETGLSHIHSHCGSEQAYLTMIKSNKQCQKFCCELLMRYDELLNRFTPINPKVYQGYEIEAFIALSNLERSLNQDISFREVGVVNG